MTNDDQDKPADAPPPTPHEDSPAEGGSEAHAAAPAPVVAPTPTAPAPLVSPPAPVVIARRRPRRLWLKWMLFLFPLLVLLVGAAVVGSVYLPMRMPYDREEDPWFTPLKTYEQWRWEGLWKSPTALYDALKYHDPAYSRQKLVALTFDDGPYPLYTPLLLAMLRHYDVKATFFLVGLHVDQYPELTREIVRDGHEIGNHTYTHRREKQFKPGELRTELLRTEQAIARASGASPSLFRPAGGFMTHEGVTTIRDLGYTMCNYTVNPGDWWQTDPEKIIRYMYKGRSQEGIVLLHSGTLGTIRMLPGYIGAMKEKGYKFVTVTELGKAVGDPVPPNPRAAQNKQATQAELPEVSPNGPNGSIQDS